MLCQEEMFYSLGTKSVNTVSSKLNIKFKNKLIENKVVMTIKQI